MTMISKRIERGERVDVFDLFDTVAANVEEIQKQHRQNCSGLHFP
jgi:hypothetical protein